MEVRNARAREGDGVTVSAPGDRQGVSRWWKSTAMKE
jgi:hypothetical protein